MVYYPSVEEIVRAWRKAAAAEAGSPLKELYELKGTITPQVKVADISYSAVETLSENPWRATSLFYTNGTSLEQSATYESEEQVGTTFTSTVETSTDTTVEVGFTVGWPSGSNINGKVSVTAGRRDSTSTTKSTTDTRRVVWPFRVPPRTKVSAQAYATKKVQRVAWTARLAILGAWDSGKVCRPDGHKGQRCDRVWAYLPELIMSVQQRQLIDMTGWTCREASEMEMKEIFGGLALEDAYPNRGFDIPYVLATGIVTGEMLFEDFVGVNVEVREVGPAYTEAPGTAVTVDRGATGELPREGSRLLATTSMEGLGKVVERQDHVLGAPVTMLEYSY